MRYVRIITYFVVYFTKKYDPTQWLEITMIFKILYPSQNKHPYDTTARVKAYTAQNISLYFFAWIASRNENSVILSLSLSFIALLWTDAGQDTTFQKILSLNILSVICLLLSIHKKKCEESH